MFHAGKEPEEGLTLGFDDAGERKVVPVNITTGMSARPIAAS